MFPNAGKSGLLEGVIVQGRQILDSKRTKMLQFVDGGGGVFAADGRTGAHTCVDVNGAAWDPACGLDECTVGLAERFDFGCVARVL